MFLTCKGLPFIAFICLNVKLNDTGTILLLIYCHRYNTCVLIGWILNCCIYKGFKCKSIVTVFETLRQLQYFFHLTPWFCFMTCTKAERAPSTCAFVLIVFLNCINKSLYGVLIEFYCLIYNVYVWCYFISLTWLFDQVVCIKLP